jgi:hypothetical protein
VERLLGEGKAECARRRGICQRGTKIPQDCAVCAVGECRIDVVRLGTNPWVVISVRPTAKKVSESIGLTVIADGLVGIQNERIPLGGEDLHVIDHDRRVTNAVSLDDRELVAIDREDKVGVAANPLARLKPPNKISRCTMRLRRAGSDS